MITYTTPSFSLALDSTDNKVEALLHSNSTLGYTIILHTQCEVEGNILEIEKKTLQAHRNLLGYKIA